MSITSIHADLPFGTPVNQGLLSRTMSQPSFFNRKSTSSEAASIQSRKSERMNENLSAGDYSSFSSAGDPLPDELEGDTVVQTRVNIQEDLRQMHHIASLVAKQRGVSADLLMPQVVELCRCAAGTTSGVDVGDGPSGGDIIAKMSKAKGLRGLRKPKAHTISSTAPELDMRRFSFDPGDDSSYLSHAHQSLPAGLEQSPLIRTMSLSQLPEGRIADGLTASIWQQPIVSGRPPPPSPLVRAPSGSSKIPSPSFDPALARPRREDSNSSYFTAIRNSQVSLSSRNSESSSPREAISPALSRSASRYSPSGSGGSVGGRRLVEEKTGLRNGSHNLAVAAARTAGSLSSQGSTSDIREVRHVKRPSAQSSNGGQSKVSQPTLGTNAKQGKRNSAETFGK